MQRLLLALSLALVVITTANASPAHHYLSCGRLSLPRPTPVWQYGTTCSIANAVVRTCVTTRAGCFGVLGNAEYLPTPPFFQPQGFRCYQGASSGHAGSPGTPEGALPILTRPESAWVLCERDRSGGTFVTQRIAFWV